MTSKSPRSDVADSAAPVILASARLRAYSRPARINSIASTPARSMLAGSSVMPSLVSTKAADGSTSPSSTSCTDTGSLSGSWPRENVKQPCGSRSTSNTRRPFSAIAAPNDATVVVLATPPFWLATASTRVTLPSKHARRPQHGWWGRIFGVAPQTHRLLLLRHGETEWSLSGKHTSRTELDLTDAGRAQAKSAGETLARLELDNPYVVSSPRKRALVTAELAGLNGRRGDTADQRMGLRRLRGHHHRRDPQGGARLAGVDARLPRR